LAAVMEPVLPHLGFPDARHRAHAFDDPL